MPVPTSSVFAEIRPAKGRREGVVGSQALSFRCWTWSLISVSLSENCWICVNWLVMIETWLAIMVMRCAMAAGSVTGIGAGRRGDKDHAKGYHSDSFPLHGVLLSGLEGV